MKSFFRLKFFFHYFSKHIEKSKFLSDKIEENASSPSTTSKTKNADSSKKSFCEKCKNSHKKNPAPKKKSEGPGKKSNIKPEPKNKDSLFEDMIEESMKETPVSKFKQSAETSKPVHQAVSEYPPPQKSLDLHGITKDIAVKKIRWFVSNCRKEGKLTVRIITGIGKHSSSGPVLKEVAEKEASMLKKKKQLLFFKWDKKKKYKSSSILLFLKPAKKNNIKI